MFPFLREVQGKDYDILAALDYIDSHRPFYTESTDDCYVEYKSLIGLTSLALLSCGCRIMHAVAVLYEELCWLISAPPGTGKTTQYKNLKILYRDEVEMVCGDMPLLETTGEGSIIVHPTPWNGKERIRGRKSAPLGGILLLRQGTGNMIRRLEPEEAVIPVFLHMMGLPDTEEQALQIAAFVDQMLKQYPVWEMVNLGDKASSVLAADTFRAYVRGCHEI